MMRSQDVIFFAGIAVILLVPTALIAFVAGAGGRHLPHGAMVHSSPGEVVCVMRGAVNQEADLYTALMVVSDLSTPI